MGQVWIASAVGAVVVVALAVIAIWQTFEAAKWRRRCEIAVAMGRPRTAQPVRQRRYLAAPTTGRRSPRRVELKRHHQATTVLPKVVPGEQTVEIKPGGVR